MSIFLEFARWIVDTGTDIVLVLTSWFRRAKVTVRYYLLVLFQVRSPSNEAYYGAICKPVLDGDDIRWVPLNDAR